MRSVPRSSPWAGSVEQWLREEIAIALITIADQRNYHHVSQPCGGPDPKAHVFWFGRQEPSDGYAGRRSALGTELGVLWQFGQAAGAAAVRWTGGFSTVQCRKLTLAGFRPGQWGQSIPDVCISGSSWSMFLPPASCVAPECLKPGCGSVPLGLGAFFTLFHKDPAPAASPGSRRARVCLWL